MAIGTVTFTNGLIFDGDTSPKFIVTTKSLSTLELPVTEPFLAPVIVGVPPEEMSNAWAATLPRHPSEIAITTINRILRRSYGVVAVNVTAIVLVPFS